MYKGYGNYTQSVCVCVSAIVRRASRGTMIEAREEQVHGKKQVMIALAALLCPIRGGTLSLLGLG